MARALRQEMQAACPLKVVLGAGETRFDGWFNTDTDILNITAPADWIALFAPGSIDRLLAEHVFEHLSESQTCAALMECQRYLKPGGRLRIAVPDGYRPDPVYLAEVRPPADGHQVLFTIDSLMSLLESQGFRATPLEFFDQAGQFHCQP
jgi:predicted SAM-dependent methyltransferase